MPKQASRLCLIRQGVRNGPTGSHRPNQTDSHANRLRPTAIGTADRLTDQMTKNQPIDKIPAGRSTVQPTCSSGRLLGWWLNKS